MFVVSVPSAFNLLYAVFKSLTGVVGDLPSFELFPFLDTKITVAFCHTAFKLVTVFGISSYNPYILALSAENPFSLATAHPLKLYADCVPFSYLNGYANNVLLPLS